jgi:hypothetical protein
VVKDCHSGNSFLKSHVGETDSFHGMMLQEVPIMGFRFRRRIKIISGFWFNLSKRGISTSIGGKGLTVNLKGDKVMTTASLPGTGLSYRKISTGGQHEAQEQARGTIPWWVLLLVIVAVTVGWCG